MHEFNVIDQEFYEIFFINVNTIFAVLFSVQIHIWGFFWQIKQSDYFSSRNLINANARICCN